MKTSVGIVILMILASGCDPGPTGPRAMHLQPGCPASYWPSAVNIIPLTEFKTNGEPSLNIFVDLVDPWQVRMKSPAVFRFELYEYVPRAASPIGKRLYIWSDIDLIDPDANNRHWRDFARAYEFELPLDVELARGTDYVVQATVVVPTGRRYIGQLRLKY